MEGLNLVPHLMEMWGLVSWSSMHAPPLNFYIALKKVDQEGLVGEVESAVGVHNADNEGDIA